MRIFRDIVLAILAAVLVTLALEGGLRVTHERFDASLFQPDPERGYSLRPYAEGWIETDGEVYFKINSDGMRDRERPLQRPAGVLRVAIVGSSDVEGYGVPLEQTFEAVLERRLMELFKPRGKQADVLNFGVAGYSGPQEYLTLQNHVWKYDPQIVVVVWNQFLGLKNTRRTYPEDPESAAEPYYALRNGVLEPTEPARAMKAAQSLSARQIALRNRLADWMNASYALVLLNQARTQLQRQIGDLRARMHRNGAGPKSDAAGPPPHFIQWWPYLPYLPEMQEDWAITEALLRKMKEDCDRHGAEFFIVITDEEMQTHPDLAARRAFMERWGLSGLDESDKRMQKLSQTDGISVMPLAPALGEYAVMHHAFLHGSGEDNIGHWNKLGNQLVGQLIFDDLRTHSTLLQAWETARQ